jgi:hypothetical protein
LAEAGRANRQNIKKKTKIIRVSATKLTFLNSSFSEFLTREIFRIPTLKLLTIEKKIKIQGDFDDPK